MIDKYLKIASDLGDSRAARKLAYKEAQKRKLPSELVWKVQSELNRSGLKIGNVDGKFGLKTFAALRAFECINGTPLSGTPTKKALEKLKSSKIQNYSRQVLVEKFFEGISNLKTDCVRGALKLGVNPNSRKYRRGPIYNVSKHANF